MGAKLFKKAYYWVKIDWKATFYLLQTVCVGFH